VYGSFRTGTWRYQNGWKKITAAVTAINMDATSGGTLFASFGSGTWKYNSDYGWVRLTRAVAWDIAVVHYDLVYATFAKGTFSYNWGIWNYLTSGIANEMSADGDSFVGSFDDGIWELEDGYWLNLEFPRADLVA
jgi:hypothetical protein